MNFFRILLVTATLLIGGCTHMYSHAFRVESVEPLSSEELKNVFASFRAYLTDKGMVETIHPSEERPDFAAFALGTGHSGLLRQPFEDYLQLSYTPDNGFVLSVVRIIDHPIDFSDQYIAEFKTTTEELIREASSKSVRLQLISRLRH